MIDPEVVHAYVAQSRTDQQVAKHVSDSVASNVAKVLVAATRPKAERRHVA